MPTYRTQSGLLVEADLQTEMSLEDARSLKRKLLDTADEVEQALRHRGEAKRPTFQQARDALLKYLDSKGWDVKTYGASGTLKVPHATSRYMDTKLWFKTQAVYVSGVHGKLNDAYSTWLDIRDMTPEQFLNHIETHHR
jgi:predicted AlkP superfamily phosphohydrolase/phosphomutase